MTIKKVAYECLQRWNHNTGALQGCHVKFYEWSTDANGVVIPGTGKEGVAMSVAVAGQQGFPLSDVLSTLQIGAITAMEQARAELAAEKAAHEITKATLLAKIAALEIV